MSEVINGYLLREPMSNRDAGFAKWGQAEKNGQKYFIKELLNPRYPTKNSPYSEDMKKSICSSCEKFEHEKSLLYRQLNEVSDGNVLRVEEFFRWDGGYYVVTRWLERAQKSDGAYTVDGKPLSLEWLSDGDSLSVEDVSVMGEQQSVRACLALSHAVMKLHSVRIVHADIKPNNVILTRTAFGGISVKLIDMESSFFESDPPDEVIGDQVYFAPESFMHMMMGSKEHPIGRPIDVFALGLVFHQMLAGSLPDLGEDYNYAFEACLDMQALKISDKVPVGLREVLEGMLQKNAADRMTMTEVYKSFWEYVYGPEPVIDVEPDTLPDDAFTGTRIEDLNREELKEAARSRIRFSSTLKPTADKDDTFDESSSRLMVNGAFYRPKGL